MSVEENTPKAEETQIPAKAEIQAETGENEQVQPESTPVKSGKAGWVVLVLAVIAAGAAFGIPQSRQEIVAAYQRYAASFQKDSEPVVEQAKAPENAEIASRLEQLENERDFTNAETIVATVEEPAAVVTVDNAGYKALAEQQKLMRAAIDGLQEQLRQLQAQTDGRLQKLQEAMPKAGLLEERLLAVNARADAFEQKLVEDGVKIDRLERNKADAAAVLSLITRMEVTERKLRASNAEKERAAILLLTMYQLREAALSGQNFMTEQQAALALTTGHPAIASKLRSLAVAADQGVWSKNALVQSFNAYADKAALSVSVSEKTDWFHQAINSLKALVVVRRIDAPADDTSVQAVLARAAQAVKDDDLTMAVAYLKTLNGTAGEAMHDWVAAAQRYVSTRKTINETIAAVLGVVYAEQAKGE